MLGKRAEVALSSVYRERHLSGEIDEIAYGKTFNRSGTICKYLLFSEW